MNRGLAAAAFILGSGLVAGAAAATNPDAAAPVKIAHGPVRMPSGVDFGRMQLVNEARLIRVYTQMTGVGDSSDDKLLFSRDVAQKVNLTNRQVNRRFMDMILATRRFQVFDDSTTVVRDGASQTLDGKLMDITIDGQVVGSTQDIIDILPYRKARTAVRLSVQMKDVSSGEQLFPAGVSVNGEWGMAQGEGTLLPPSASTSSPEMQISLANDYQRALDKALTQAVSRIGQVLRPLGRVTFDMAQLGERQVIAHTQPLAVAHCDGVGTETSQCDLTLVDTRYHLAVGDYAVLSDRSASGVRGE